MTQQRRTPIDDSIDPDDLFHSIRSRIAESERAAEGDGISVDLLLSAVPEIPRDPRAAVPGVPPSASPPSASPPSGPPPERLGSGYVLRGRYVIESQVGSGGMGTVYKALDRSRSEHNETEPHVAIKILHEQTQGRPEVVSKLRREFYSAQVLSHPSVVKVYELDLDHDFSFFTMELIEGESLFSVMQKLHPLPRHYVWAVIREVGRGLAHAHDRRVIHGDLKPQNVMVTNNRELRILDFGTSSESATALTPAYASCEILEGREPDPRDDLFALACLSYELLAGQHPFEQRRSTEARSLKMTPQRPPGLSGRQWKALTAALSWDRADRPRSVRDWLADLALDKAPLGAIPKAQDSKAPPLAKGHGPSVLIAVSAAILVCGITWAVMSRPRVPHVAVEADTVAASAPLNVARAIADAEKEESQASAEAAPAPSKAVVKSRASGAVAAARPIDKTEKIGVVSALYSIGRGGKFAEIRVYRSSGSKGGTSVDWWTEPGSALAGTDFVPQTPATISFRAGERTVSIFIKLLPNASRKRNGVFYVVLGNPSSGSSLGAVSKAAVSLQP
ncbi:MAG TPA: protein kinase [Steroidobacteraceae bacterium]|nr:protein kinase [Steroidobacteraceae bacterium]